MAAAPPKKNILCLFDVDGTLTPARKVANPETLRFLGELRARVTTGMVGGSDLAKQREQLGEGVLHLFDYVFPENGLAAYRGGESIGSTSFLQHLGEARMKEFINFTLVYIAMLDIPIKRGTFIEFRNGMLNVSPIGRNCSQAERDDFERYDHEHKVRDTMVRVLSARFDGFGLKYSIGGQISFDVFPIVRARASRPPARRAPRGALLTPTPTPCPAPPRRAGIRPFASATSSSSASTKSTSLATRPSPAATTTRSSRRRR
jgi:phosphomannomutase